VPAYQIASLVHEGFDTFYAEFMRLTRAARPLFDGGQWARLHEQSQARIDLYQKYVARTLAAIGPITRRYPEDLDLWRQAHVHFAELVCERPDVEVAETFFNAITRKIFHTMGVKPEIEFLDADEARYRRRDVPGQIRRFAFDPDLPRLFAEILRHTRPALRFADLEAEACWLAEAFREGSPLLADGGGIEHIDVIRPLFFRVREGYIVGRAVRGDSVAPIVIPVQPSPRGMVVDGGLFRAEDVRDVFTATRPYFFLEMRRPKDIVDFLASLMPLMARSELWICIAHHRHGKSVIYRELMDHLATSDDPLVIAPGIRGLVMTVFTTASYRNVFKIIRDLPEKSAVSRADVLGSYRDVFRGQRAGRLADTQEFEHLAFQRSRFDPACLRELVAKAGNVVEVQGDSVVVHHLYTEEKMTPLNLYLQAAEREQAERALVDYGAAIKELAYHDVFAGDLLWKNFGVNRFGHLVLYDYDEIQPVHECRFREIPEARTEEEEMSATPWYSIGVDDVFPEEWVPFVVPSEPVELRDAFMSAHGELFSAAWWRGVQADLRAGRVHVRLPYAPRHPELQA
jgi:isocitrate dehydrogenase kinase/phosphatase